MLSPRLQFLHPCGYTQDKKILTDVRLDDVGLGPEGHAGEVDPGGVGGGAGFGVPLCVEGRRAVDDAVRALSPQVPSGVRCTTRVQRSERPHLGVCTRILLPTTTDT